MSFPSPRYSGRWNGKSLLLCHIIALFLIWSLFWPCTSPYWEKLDRAFFRTLNHTLQGPKSWQLFWALANHKLADWVEDLVILVFFLFSIRRQPPGLRYRRAADYLSSVLYIALIIYWVNRVLFREHLQIPRPSPTLVVEPNIKLSEKIPWLHIKDDSLNSFPGDHATTALLFASSFTYLHTSISSKWRSWKEYWPLSLLACLYAAFLCLPRLITGAHWLSDVLVGSGSIALVCLSWAFCTPFHTWTSTHIEILFQKTARLYKEIKAMLKF